MIINKHNTILLFLLNFIFLKLLSEKSDECLFNDKQIIAILHHNFQEEFGQLSDNSFFFILTLQDNY